VDDRAESGRRVWTTETRVDDVCGRQSYLTVDDMCGRQSRGWTTKLFQSWCSACIASVIGLEAPFHHCWRIVLTSDAALPSSPLFRAMREPVSSAQRSFVMVLRDASPVQVSRQLRHVRMRLRMAVKLYGVNYLFGTRTNS